MPHPVKTIPLFPLLTLASAGCLLAQAENPSNAASAIPADGPTIELSPEVVTAQRTERPLTVTFDAKEPVQPIPAQDGADFLKTVPGFTVIRKGGTDGDPVLRGMAGSRLCVQLDGAACLGGCGNRMDPPTAYVFPSAYDRITVLKGPQTVLYGPGNSAGVVLFESDLHRFDLSGAEAHASLTAGSFGRFDGVVDARGGTPDFFGRAAFTHTEADDYTDGSGLKVHALNRRWSANGAVGWTPDAHTQLEFSGARSDGKAAYADRAMDGVKFDRDNVAVRFRREQLSPLVEAVEFQAFRNYIDHVMDNYTLRPFVPAMMMPGRSSANPDRLTRGGKAQATLACGGGCRVTAGSDCQFNRHTMRKTSNETTDPYEVKARDRDADFRQAGVFGEFERKSDDGSRFVAGARLDFWQAQDFRPVVATSMMATAPNPSAGRTRDSQLAGGFARYERLLAAAGATLYVGVGHTERFPDYWEMIKNESAASVSAFGTMPEKTTQLDTGVVLHRGAVDVSVSAFASEIDDFNLVQSNFVKPAGMMGTRLATITRNIDASTLGGEIGAGWRLAEHWKADASLAYVRGTNKTDAVPLAQMPPLEWRLSLVYTRRAWSVGGLIRAVAAQNRVAVNQGNIVGQDIGPSAGFAVVSLNAAWQFVRHGRISVGLDNLFDRTYAEHISRAGSAVEGYTQTMQVNEPGRTLWTKLDLTF
jgi:iron complex outermembrane receptor protein